MCEHDRIIIIICVAELQTICKEYWNRLFKLEGDKFDLEHIEKVKAQEVNVSMMCKTIKKFKFIKKAPKQEQKNKLHSQTIARNQKKKTKTNQKNKRKKKTFTKEKKPSQKKNTYKNVLESFHQQISINIYEIVGMAGYCDASDGTIISFQYSKKEEFI